VSPTQAERTQATTARLVSTAREQFADRGYAGTSLESVAAAAGVTKGALYHHFRGKRELFEAVFVAEQQRLCEVIAAAGGLRAGMHAYLEACLDPGVQRITLLDALAVLGWERMRGIEADYGLRLLREGVARALPERDAEAVAHLLFGALCEAPMFIARAGDQREALRRMTRELDGLLAALGGAR
jgi:AcrR family transcriptional regulator